MPCRPEDALKPWWRPPPEFREEVERRQDELRAEFGGFTEGYINIAGIVASPDGKRIGFAFVADDGTKSRVVLDSEFAADQFHTALAYAIDEAVRFHLGGVPPQGRA